MGPVAGAARKGPLKKKRQKRIDARNRDFERVADNKKAPSGGYHKPGSMQI